MCLWHVQLIGFYGSLTDRSDFLCLRGNQVIEHLRIVDDTFGKARRC